MKKNYKKFVTFISISLLIFLKFSLVKAIEKPDFSELAEELIPSVVSVSVMISANDVVSQPRSPQAPQFPPGSPFEDFFKDFFERRGVPPRGMPPPRQKRNQSAMGSGFIIDKKGLIVTNNHVIANASSITVILHDGTSLQAKLLGSDAKTDLALLKVETKIKLKTVKWGDSDEIKVGNWAMAIGNPFGLVNTVTVGIVSARARDINAGPFDDFIQTDASINRGNSGGPLFNLNGDVIGVNTAIYSPSGGSVGIGFAIPSALAQNIVQQLEDHGRTIRGWLGVRIQTVTDDLASSLGLEKAYGALVASSIPNSPAEKAGIKAGDIILNFNGKDVTEMRKLPRFVAETEVNKEVNIVVWRNEKKKTLKVSIAEMKEDKKIMAKKEADKKTTLKEDDISDLKIRVSQITDNIRLRQNIPEDITGLLITRVEQNSDAERKGIRPGDIIQEVNQTSVNSIEKLRSIIKTLKGKKKGVLLLVNRQGNINFVALKLN
ncbi:Do family serine endopeptidase [Alphaproteobacteria bacterium]|nr:Do family serine endopeptidase [Alphaproteobacteria bacterium]